MAGRPLDAMALIGIGFRNISMSPPALAPVKAMIRSVDLESLRPFVDSLFVGGQRSLREKLRAYAQDHGVLI